MLKTIMVKLEDLFCDFYFDIHGFYSAYFACRVLVNNPLDFENVGRAFSEPK